VNAQERLVLPPLEAGAWHPGQGAFCVVDKTAVKRR
jgi:hypothetical protein